MFKTIFLVQFEVVEVELSLTLDKPHHNQL